MATRRQVMATLAMTPLLFSLEFDRSYANNWPRIIVGKSDNCGCCSDWVKHLEQAGFLVQVENLSHADLATLKSHLGIPPTLQSCHTGYIEGYVFEGHIPASDIKRFLTDRPDAKGLAVPGMPPGSPGMEYGSEREAYDVLLINHNGSTSIFAQHS